MHQIASGTLVASKYQGLPGHIGYTTAPLDLSKGFIFGLPNCGKSALVQSIPDAYVFNLDKSSVTTGNAQATVWPLPDPETGRLMTDGPFNWEQCDRHIKTLYELAKANKPRPKTIVFDSLTTMIQLLRDHAGTHAAALSLGMGPTFRDLDGRRAWDWVYDTILSTLNGLHSVGYGVIYTGHMTNAVIQIDDNKNTIRPQFTITDNLWARLSPHFDYCTVLQKKIETITDVTPIEKKVGNRTVTIDQKNTRTEARVYLYSRRADMNALLKVRDNPQGPPFPDQLLIPRDKGWSAILDALAPESPSSTESPSTEADPKKGS